MGADPSGPWTRLSALWLLAPDHRLPRPCTGTSVPCPPQPAACTHLLFLRRRSVVPGVHLLPAPPGPQGPGLRPLDAGSRVACPKPLSPLPVPLLCMPLRELGGLPPAGGLLAPDLCPSRNRETSAHQAAAVRGQPTPTSALALDRKEATPPPPPRRAACHTPWGPQGHRPAPRLPASLTSASRPPPPSGWALSGRHPAPPTLGSSASHPAQAPSSPPSVSGAVVVTAPPASPRTPAWARGHQPGSLAGISVQQ